jgi:hypothetical protein
LAPGSYTAVRTQVDFEFLDIFPPLYVVLDTWDRESSTVGVNASSYVDGRYGASYVYDVTPGPQPTVHVTATTNCWFVIADADGNPVNQWVPASPVALRTAYSVYLLGPGTPLSVPEFGPGPDLVAYPSPASDVLHVHLPAGLAGNHTLDVVDVTGHIVLRQAVQAGSTGLQLAVHALAQGTYCLRLWNAREDFTTRFVKY